MTSPSVIVNELQSNSQQYRHGGSHRHRSSSVSSERPYRRTSKPNASTSSSNTRNSIQRSRLSAKTTPMHDDTDAGRLIPVVRPVLAIDYLGNGWSNEDDIAASWKFMTKQKNDLINGLRLENASWRNWAKQRHNLKTISPRTLNWLKDSDTTWLYGPLYKASIDEFDLARFGAQTVPGGTKVPASPTRENRLKPVLKYKTASELFKADTLFHIQSDLRLERKIKPNSKAQETAVIKQHRQPKLRFNDSVEQCVSIDADAHSDDELVEDDEEDAGILMRISEKRPTRSIVRIHPTKLKAESMYGMDTDDKTDKSLTPTSSYADSGLGYIKPRRAEDENNDDDDDVMAGVIYSRPVDLPPSPAETRRRDSSLLGPEKIQASKGGIGQRAFDIVNNVKDIVHWASSLVYNSSTF